VWTAYGRPHAPLPHAPVALPRPVRRLVHGPDARARLGAAARAAGAATAVLVGGGALLAGTSLVWHGDAARASFLQLTEGWTGRFAVLLLGILLIPNASVWAASYALGPGFLLGAGHPVHPLVSDPAPLLPPFPLLAAVPDAGAGTQLNWAAALVPAVAGMTAGWFVGRAAVRRPRPGEPARARWSAGRTAEVHLLTALVCAAFLALLAELAGGPLGAEALARFGPVWWQTGGAAGIWTAMLGMPVALAVRAWRVRERWMRAGAIPAQGADTGAPKPRAQEKARGAGDPAEKARPAKGTTKAKGRPLVPPAAVPGGADLAEDDRYDVLPADDPFPPGWHDDLARASRWAALRETAARRDLAGELPPPLVTEPQPSAAPGPPAAEPERGPAPVTDPTEPRAERTGADDPGEARERTGANEPAEGDQ
jgi:hypothetical protein